MSLLLRGRGRRGRRASVLAFAGTLLAFQALALIGALPAYAATCTFTGGVLTAAAAGGEAITVSRDAAGAITVAPGATCTAVATGATVATTTAISITGDAGVDAVTIDLDNGGWGTINWTLAPDGGAGEALTIDSDDAAVKNSVVFGASGIDLNGDGDLDVTHSGFETFVVNGGPGDDTLSANGSTATGAAFASAITLNGEADNDSILGGAGGDALDGGAGSDWIDCSTTVGGATFTVPAGVALDKCGVGTDTWAGFENIVGTSVTDKLTGDGGANSFKPGAGDDTVTGAAGADTLDYSNLTAAVTVDSKTGKTSGGAGVDTFTTIETIVGSSSVADTLDFSGETTATSANLATGAVTGATSAFTTATDFENAKGGTGVDTYIGSAGRNTLEGGDGDDVLSGAGGNDVVLGGKGNNTLSGGDGFDFTSYATASGGVTVDLSLGFASSPDGDDTLTGFENVDGSAFKDTIRGNEANNTLRGLGGSDNIKASTGDDTVRGGAGSDALRGGGGDDDLFGQKGNDALFGGGGTDLCKGGPGVDTQKGCEL